MTNCPERTTPGSGRYHCRLDAGLQSEYGPQMTCDVYWTQFYAQDGACGACLRPWEGTPGAPRSENAENRLSVDHEHAGTTAGVHGADGSFRGLLCRPCNRLLTAGVVEKILRRVDEDVIALSGGDVVTASQVAYVRNPPAGGTGIWITGRQRPAGTGRGRAKVKRDEITPYRSHLRAALRPSAFTCEAGCRYGGHGGVVRVPARRSAAPPPRAVQESATVVDPVWWVVLAALLTPRRRCILGCPCASARS